MKNQRIPPSDLMVVTDRPAFLAEVRHAAGEIEGIRVAALDGGPRPGALAACLAALEAHPAAVLIVDAGPDATSALLLVQEIFDHTPSPRVFLAGPSGDPELILRSQRAGSAEFLPLPLDSRNLGDALHRLWRRMTPEAAAPVRKRGRILSFLGAKGGCGATTLSTNLAVSLAAQGTPTLLVDLDLWSGDAALLLNLSPTFSVPDVIQSAHRLDRDLLNGMILRHASGLEILAAGENPERAAGVDPARIPQVLAFLREQYECVVLNTGMLADPVTQTAVAQADLIHLVTTLDLLALRRAQWCLRRLMQGGTPREMLRLVINRFDRNPFVTPEEAEKVLDLKVAWSVPRDDRSIPQALNDGIPFVTTNRNGLAGSFARYAAGLAPGTAVPVEARRKVLGFFSSRTAARPAGQGVTA